MNKTVKYYALIVISVIDLIGTLVFGTLSILCVSGIIPTTQVPDFSGIPVQNNPLGSLKILWIVLFIVCFAAMPFLAKARQKARDDFDYDEYGISRKYGHFSKLSENDRKDIEKQKLINAERILDSATMKKITHQGEADPQAAMDEMIGLDSVKQTMTEMIARMKYENEEWSQNHKGRFKPTEAMHMIFMGEPGTGKTTVARIMAGFLYQNGYIRKNQSVEVDGNFLKGETPGESSKKTAMLIQKSLGGVLFIDEAYSLLSGAGQESIATIVKEMEDHREDIVFILAGYDKEMKQLVNSNPGIESRVKYYLWFGDYTMEDYQKMLLQLAHKKDLKVSKEYLAAFVKRMKYERTQKNFGNARTVRNLFEKTIDRHAVNVVNNKADKNKILASDMPEIDSHKHI